ncbi:MAG: SWIM zinc finger family protein, partial [Acidimicrobiales bacterium]
MSVVDSFESNVIETVASPQSISRGRAYAAGGKVTITTLADSELRAEVRGTTRYRVHLWMEGAGHRWRCNCPVGLNGEFCKHCVAALVAATAPPGATATDADTGRGGPNELNDFIASLPADRLTALVLEQAEIDQQFRTRLSRLAQFENSAPASGPGTPESTLDLGALKKEVTAAFGRGFISYREASAWAAG